MCTSSSLYKTPCCSYEFIIQEFCHCNLYDLYVCFALFCISYGLLQILILSKSHNNDCVLLCFLREFILKYANFLGEGK